MQEPSGASSPPALRIPPSAVKAHGFTTGIDLTLYAQMAHTKRRYVQEPVMPTLAKDTRLHIRCDNEVRRLLDKAAAYAHMSVSEFVLRNAVEQAQSIVQAHEALSLSQADFAAFLDALDQPAPANPALQRAFQRHARHVK